jgi:hypothetical protein
MESTTKAVGGVELAKRSMFPRSHQSFLIHYVGLHCYDINIDVCDWSQSVPQLHIFSISNVSVPRSVTKYFRESREIWTKWTELMENKQRIEMRVPNLQVCYEPNPSGWAPNPDLWWSGDLCSLRGNCSSKRDKKRSIGLRTGYLVDTMMP